MTKKLSLVLSDFIASFIESRFSRGLMMLNCFGRAVKSQKVLHKSHEKVFFRARDDIET